MSQQVCAEFFAKINTDAALQQEVNTALEGKEGDEATNAFVWVGAKHGYEFTAAEAAQKYQEIIAAAEGELDEEALDQVAGAGGFCCYGGEKRLQQADRQADMRRMKNLAGSGIVIFCAEGGGAMIGAKDGENEE